VLVALSLQGCLATRYPHPLERSNASADVAGRLRYHTAGRNDTLIDLAVRYQVGYVELLAANPGIDPWLPRTGTRLVIPDAHLLPPGPREGIVVNLGELRLYFFERGERPRSYPIGVARAGWATPHGQTKVTSKREKPTWVPGPSARRDGYPPSVPPGPDNPLGEYALYLGWPSYLIHGTNEPPGVGRHSSRGCIRLYPQHIEELFARTPVGTPVRVIEETVKLGWIGKDLWLEVHPDAAQALALDESGHFESASPRSLRERVRRAAGKEAARVDWTAVERAGRARTGVPLRITSSVRTPRRRRSAAPGSRPRASRRTTAPGATPLRAAARGGRPGRAAR
jgi:L,D-transpeptidase ErfK/SrfK